MPADPAWSLVEPRYVVNNLHFDLGDEDENP
jgi:hypothetical protein